MTLHHPDCVHPETKRFATTYFDAVRDGWYLWIGCTACGAVLCGNADLQGNSTGVQHRLPSKAKKEINR